VILGDIMLQLGRKKDIIVRYNVTCTKCTKKSCNYKNVAIVIIVRYNCYLFFFNLRGKKTGFIW